MWISVSEQAPPYDTKVLVWDGEDVIRDWRTHTSAKGEHWACTFPPESNRQVTHWMPLPEPPR